MNDEQMQPLLRTWFRARKVAPTDVPNGVDQVMARVPEVRQRGRWWPLPAFHRKLQTPTATDTTDYQPRPIPATNGHAPTVIGRTQTMFSPVKAITAGALVFAIGGVMLIAQPFDQQSSVPGAQETDLSGVTVTVTQECGGGSLCTWTASDPRLPDTLEYEWTGNVEDNAAGDAGLDAGLAWMDVGFEGSDGGWTGHVYTLWGEPTQAFLVLGGTGANEGWQYIASSIHAPDSNGDFEWIGTLYEGELPPYPEAPAE